MTIEPARKVGGLTAATASSHPNPTPLVGRDIELQTLMRFLERGGATVVNVTGARGTGKSALVRAALDLSASGFADIQRLDLTGETLTSALTGLRRHLSRMPIVLHRGDLARAYERTLLYLEGADVLARSGRDLVRLVSGQRALVMVIESVPQVRGPEIGVVQVGPLGATAADELFRRTAGSVAVSLGHDEESAAYVRRICAAVDANPLAIELAAVRLPFVPLASLVAVLESPERALSVLTRPDTAAGSARAVRTDLADSHHAASADAQRLLDLLSVFSGSFTIGAIEAVSAGQVSPCYDALSELIDLRLVELDQAAGVGRYRLSNLVRGFAAERLAASGLEPGAQAGRTAFCSDRARRASAAFDDADEDRARRILGEDYPEALATLRWLSATDPDGALRLAADLGWEADRRGSGSGLVEVLTELTQTECVGTDAARRDALLWLARLASWSPLVGDRSGLIGRQLAEALDLGRRLAEPLPLLRALRTQFIAAVGLGDIRTAMASCVEGLQLASEIGHARWLGRFEISLGAVHALLRQYEEAARLAASGLARAIRSGDRRGIALGSLALHAMPAEHVMNRAELPSLEAVLDIFRSWGDLRNEMHTLATLAQEAIDRDDPRGAATWVMTRQERLGRTDLLNGLTISVMLGVHISRLRGDYAMGARLHGAVASHMEPLMAIMSPVHAALYRNGLDTLRASLGANEFDTQVARGRLLDRDETLAELMNYLRDVAPVVPRQPPSRAADDQRTDLTPKEQQVLALLARGLHNKEIASEVGVTPKSVMHHTVSIYRKLGVRGRTEAVTAAARTGLLPIS